MFLALRGIIMDVEVTRITLLLTVVLAIILLLASLVKRK